MSVVFCYGIPSQLIQPVLCSPLMLPISPKSKAIWAPSSSQLDDSVVWQITWVADNLQLGPRKCKNDLGKLSMKGTQYKLFCLEEDCPNLADYSKYPQENNQTKPIEKWKKFQRCSPMFVNIKYFQKLETESMKIIVEKILINKITTERRNSTLKINSIVHFVSSLFHQSTATSKLIYQSFLS